VASQDLEPIATSKDVGFGRFRISGFFSEFDFGDFYQKDTIVKQSRA